MKMIFFFNDTATTEIYTLSLHDALPISLEGSPRLIDGAAAVFLSVSASGGEVSATVTLKNTGCGDRKSTRLNSSHANISYAVFCLKQKPMSHTPLSLTSCASLLNPLTSP